MKFIRKILINHLFFLFILFISFIPLSASNILQIHDASGEPYDTITVYVEIINDDQFVAFQFDLPLPEQITYLLNSACLTDRSVDHIIISSIINDDTLRILSYSPTNTAFIGNNGNIAYFKLVAGNVPGNYPLNLVNPIISDSNSTNILTDVINGTITILSNGVNYPETIYDKTQFSILQNYPNPFNPYRNRTTTISFSATNLHRLSQIKIYNITGQLVKHFGIQSTRWRTKSEFNKVVWDGRDYKGMRVSSGVYFCRLESKIKGTEPLFSKVHKLVIIE